MLYIVNLLCYIYLFINIKTNIIFSIFINVIYLFIFENKNFINTLHWRNETWQNNTHWLEKIEILFIIFLIITVDN